MQNSWLPMCYKSLHTSSSTEVLYSSSICDSASRMFHHIKMKVNAAQMKSQLQLPVGTSVCQLSHT